MPSETGMYETFFGLKKRPFLATPTLDRYFPTESLEQAFRTVSRAIERGDGPVAVMGGPGVGKSLLCLRIADSWRRSFEVILLSSSKLCTRRALLQSLLFELRMPYRDLSEGELRLSLADRLQPSVENTSDGLVLIVDEAQTLPLKLLEELRLLTNLAYRGESRVRLVLVGNLRLDESLGHPRMESLNQRLACRCYLRSLTSDESVRMIKHKLEICGVDASKVFTEDALRTIHRSTDGIPRLLDQVANHAMCLAATTSQKPVSSSLVERAWAELQQLPSPWLDPSPVQNASSVEFGVLADEEEDEFEVEHDDVAVVHIAPEQDDLDEDFPNEFTVSSKSTELAGETLNREMTPNYESLEEAFGSSQSIFTYQAYDIDECVTIETLDPFDQDLVSFAPLGQGNSMSNSTPHSDPFGADFVEETRVPSQTDSNASSTGLDPEPEHSLPSLESSSPPVPVETLEDRLNLEETTVENEIREMISSLNENAAQYVRETNIPRLAEPNHWANETGMESVRDNKASVLAFATMGKKFGPSVGQAIGDDRDLLVIEEELESQASGIGMDSASTASNAQYVPPHSYVQLFSKLRG